jgi:hypothetical protein
MRVSLAYAFPLLLVCSCGSDDSASPSTDASADGSSAADAGDEDCLFCGSIEDVGAPQGDSSGMMMQDGAMTSCAEMEAAVAGYQAAAQACNSNLAMQCNATTMGVCCPITVTSSNTDAVSNFDVSVASYVAACNPNCSMTICTNPAPSHACVAGPMASGDVCE